MLLSIWNLLFLLINQCVAHFYTIVLHSDHFLIFPVIIRWRFSCLTKTRIKMLLFIPTLLFLCKMNGLITPTWFCKMNGLITPTWFCTTNYHFIRIILTIRWKFNSVTKNTVFHLMLQNITWFFTSYCYTTSSFYFHVAEWSKKSFNFKYK